MFAHFYCPSAGGTLNFTEDHRYALITVLSREGRKVYVNGLDTIDLAASYLQHCYDLT